MNREKDVRKNRKPRKEASARRSTWSLERVESPVRAKLFQVFAKAVKGFLAGDPSFDTREKVIDHINTDPELGKELGRKLDVRQFDNLLKWLYRVGNLRVATRTITELERHIEASFHPVRATVSAGTSSERFQEVAAEKVIQEFARIGKGKGNHPLCIGIVSGSTIKGVIDKMCEMDWAQEVGVHLRELPRFKIFALNVASTDPESLGANATVLAQKLAERINNVLGLEHAEAYGLNAELIVAESRRKEVDCLPQTRDVLAYTEPFRVGLSKEYSATKLDIVLTGVGQLGPGAMAQANGTERASHALAAQGMQDDVKPAYSGDKHILDTNRRHALHDTEAPGRSSIFYKLIKEAEFLQSELIRPPFVVGDLGYTPLSADGQVAQLIGKGKRSNEFNGGDAEEKPQAYFVYSAARITIFDAMVRDTNKAVILFAQSSPAKNKIPIIYASITGPMNSEGDTPRHVSHLIIDEYTAKELAHYSTLSLP